VGLEVLDPVWEAVEQERAAWCKVAAAPLPGPSTHQTSTQRERTTQQSPPQSSTQQAAHFKLCFLDELEQSSDKRTKRLHATRQLATKVI